MVDQDTSQAHVQRSGRVSRSLWARFGKRAVDFVAALLLVVVLTPVWLPAALLVKLTSRGPLFFSQERVGKDGRIFRPMKFRTMSGTRKPDPKELVPLDHPEITAVGFYLRRFKIDELPQLLSILAGDMALIGPRPTLPDQVEAYDDFRRQRLLVRPGMTGLAQVNGNTALSWDQRILYDIAYVRRCRFFLDVAIVLRTLFVILRGEEALKRRFQDGPYADWVDIPEGYETDCE